MPALHSACVFEDGRRIIGRIDCWLWARFQAAPVLEQTRKSV